MKEHEDRYVAVVEKHNLVCADAITLMKHKHICDTSEGHTHGWRHRRCYNVVLRWLSSIPVYKMQGGVGGGEGPGAMRREPQCQVFGNRHYSHRHSVVCSAASLRNTFVVVGRQAR